MAVVEPSTPFVPGWHIDAIIEHLEAVTRGQIRNLLINVPPRHMKSLLVSVFWPAWEWIRWPERRWLYSSYAAQLSIRDSVKCRRLIESPWYQARWGDRFALTSDQNTKGRFDNNRSGYRLSTSVGGAATGEGGDRIVCDDPHNVQEAESDSIRKATHRLVRRRDVHPRERSEDRREGRRDAALPPAGPERAPAGAGRLGAPVPAGRVRRRTARHVDRLRPTRARNMANCCGPSASVPQEIESLKRSLGSYAAAGQLQQRPSPAGGGLFKRHWFRFWQPRGANLPPVMVRLPDGTQQSDRRAIEVAHGR